MAEPIRIKLPVLTPYQLEHLFHEARTVVVEASTKSGKTLGCIVWQGHQVMSDRHAQEHWWVAPVYYQAQIAYRRVKRMLPPDIYTSNDTDNRLSFVNGATWWFKSGEKPDNLYGEDVASVVIDEASRTREDSYNALRSVVTATGGPMRIIGNVKGRKNWAWRVARRAEAGAHDMHFARITAAHAVEAGLFSADELRSAEADLPEHVFRELYYAEASDDAGNPFGMEAIRRCIKPLSAKPPVAWGVDLAKSVDWTVLIADDEDGATCRFQRFQKPWAETTEQIARDVGGLRAYVDSTGVGDPIVEALQKTAPRIYGYKFTQASKQQLMEGLAVAIQRGETSYPDGPIVAELEAFEYEYTRTGVRYAAPPGLHDDCVMAKALAVACRNGRAALWTPIAVPLAAPVQMPDDGFIPMGTA